MLAFHYVALLLLKGLKPSEVVAVTFTEKAAAELKDRIQKVLRQAMEGRLPFQDKVSLKSEEIGLLLEDIPQAPISTLHGLAGKIVRDVSLLTGFDPHFEILDENEAHALKYEALREMLSKFLEEGSSPLKHLIGLYGWQNIKSQIHEMLEEWPRWSDPSLQLSEEASEEEKQIWISLRQIFSQVLGRYEGLKRVRQALDFDDLEEEALKLLQQFPLVVRHYRKLWKAYLIDEFQDTNESQDRLISMLLEVGATHASPLPKDRHLAIVGDEKQSIYAFRGAEPHIFEKLQGIIEKNGGATVTLSQNFRSPPLILGWVNSLFSQVFPNYPALITDREDPPSASLEVLSSSLLELSESEPSDPSDRHKKKRPSAEQRRNLEASLIADRVARWLQEGVKAQDIFLLFRSLSSVAIYLKALRELKVPVYVKSSESLLDRQEILDLLHALKAVAEPENPLSWVGLLRSPAVGLSDERLLEEALLHPDADWKTLSPLTQKLAQKDKLQGPFDFLNGFLEETDLITLYGAEESLSLKSQNILQFLEFSYQ